MLYYWSWLFIFGGENDVCHHCSLYHCKMMDGILEGINFSKKFFISKYSNDIAEELKNLDRGVTSLFGQVCIPNKIEGIIVCCI